MTKRGRFIERHLPYNPLDKAKLGESVANALLESPIHPLPPLPFEGAGIYAIYYHGSFEAYRKVSEENGSGKAESPIYIGKAVPRGARKGHLNLDSGQGDSLFQRLREHAESVEQTNLGASNFQCRFLVVDDIWIPLGESLMIQRFRPVWNVLLDGFGNHDPGGRRSTSVTSRWDTVHPGRSWIEKRQFRPNPKTRETWLEEIETYLSTGQSLDLVMEDPTVYSSEEGAP